MRSGSRMFSSGSHVFAAAVYPFHDTRYSSRGRVDVPPDTRFARMASTSYMSSSRSESSSSSSPSSPSLASPSTRIGVFSAGLYMPRHMSGLSAAAAAGLDLAADGAGLFVELAGAPLCADDGASGLFDGVTAAADGLLSDESAEAGRGAGAGSTSIAAGAGGATDANGEAPAAGAAAAGGAAHSSPHET